jgi:hypothetical protein
MISLDSYLFDLWATRKLSYEEMLRVAEKPEELEEKAKALSAQAQGGSRPAARPPSQTPPQQPPPSQPGGTGGQGR